MKKHLTLLLTQLIDERKNLLLEVNGLSAENCRGCEVRSASISNCKSCPVLPKFEEIGEKLQGNIARLRNTRQQMKDQAPTVTQIVVKKEIVKNEDKKESVTELSISIKDLKVEEYMDLKAQGLPDKEITHRWGIDHNKLHKFKKAHGLVGERGKPKPIKELSPSSGEEVVAPKVELLKENKITNNIPNNRLKELEDKLDHATKRIEQLISQNERLNQELWESRLVRLYAKQRELDSLVEQTQGVKVKDHLDDQLLGLLSEIVEAANEHKGFKYWKVNKTINSELLLEETVDILHFLLSRGNEIGIRISKIEVRKKENITRQFIELITVAVKIPTNNHFSTNNQYYQESFNLYAGLVEMLGFTWNEIEMAYIQKHSKNIARQQNGY